MSRAWGFWLGSGWLPGPPPGGFVKIPAAHNPCIFTSDFERRVSIPRKYAGIRVFALYKCSHRAFLDFHRGFVSSHFSLLLASVSSYFLGVVVYLIFERLGVDFELPR